MVRIVWIRGIAFVYATDMWQLALIQLWLRQEEGEQKCSRSHNFFEQQKFYNYWELEILKVWFYT